MYRKSSHRAALPCTISSKHHDASITCQISGEACEVYGQSQKRCVSPNFRACENAKRTDFEIARVLREIARVLREIARVLRPVRAHAMLQKAKNIRFEKKGALHILAPALALWAPPAQLGVRPLAPTCNAHDHYPETVLGFYMC